MQPTARGRIHCWQGGSLWIGEAGGDAGFHDHHALQISLAFRGRIRFLTRRDDWREFGAALVPPHLPHAFEGSASFTAQLFIEPETVEGRLLLARFGRDAITELPADDIARHARAMQAVDVRQADAAALEAAALELLTGLAGSHRAPVIDARIERTVAALRQHDRPVSLEQAAAAVALSPGRFRHLFVEQTGQSFRSYQLWSRLQRAIELLSAGASATDAAHGAGFADAPHLTRTFRKMMGIAPTCMKLD
jgi:AraC family transcriptional regulator